VKTHGENQKLQFRKELQNKKISIPNLQRNGNVEAAFKDGIQQNNIVKNVAR
jgi:hypothetical protein